MKIHICPLESTLVSKVRITTTNMKEDRTLINTVDHLFTGFEISFLKFKVLTNLIFNVTEIHIRLKEPIEIHIVRTPLKQLLIEMELTLLNILFGRMHSNILTTDVRQFEAVMNTIVVNGFDVTRWNCISVVMVCCDSLQGSILKHLVAQPTIITQSIKP